MKIAYAPHSCEASLYKFGDHLGDHQIYYVYILGVYTPRQYAEHGDFQWQLFGKKLLTNWVMLRTTFWKKVAIENRHAPHIAWIL